MASSVIETTDLTKRYDGVTVVDHLNLQINEQEIFGLLGPNGAGKTTTILMLLGLTEPAAGSARICGFDPTREPLKVKRLIGYMPEKVGFYDNLTARENLDFTAQLNSMGRDEARARIDQLLGQVGIIDAADMEVGKFSRGMQQRLGIADTLIKEPRVVFFDEPTAGLDPEGINQVLDLIASLPQMGTTVVLCSHLLYQVQRVCQQVGILAKGKMVAQGTLDRLGREAFAGGRYRIEIETSQPNPKLADTIKKIGGVLRVDTKDNLLSVSTDTDLRAKIAKIVTQSDVSLIQMKVQEFNLDEIYMKYFHEGQDQS